MTNPTSDVAQNIFQETIDTLHRMVNLPVSIWTPDKSRSQLSIAAAVGLPDSYRTQTVIHLNQPSVTGDVFNSLKAEVIADVMQEPRWRYKEQAQKFGWKSVLCVPIEAHGIAQGVVSIYTDSGGVILDKLKSQMELYARQIGLTMEAAHRQDILERLLEISKKFDAITNQPLEVLEEIVKSACEVTGADCAVLYPYAPDREEFYEREYVTAYGLRKELKLKEKQRSSKGMTAFVRREGEIIVENIQQQDPEMYESRFIGREGIQSFMALALGLDQIVVGFLFINFRSPHKFSAEEINTIHLFARQARNAISNMRLYAEAKQRADALKELHKINAHLVSVDRQSDYLKETLDKIAQDAQEVLRADLVDIYCYDGAEDRFLLPPSQAGERNSPPADRIYPDDVAYDLIKIQDPIFMRDVQAENSIFARPFFAHRPGAQTDERFVVRENIRSTAVIPLTFEGRPVGLLFANYRKEQTFPEPVRELLNVFATQVAVAIANASLHEQSHRQAEALKRLSTVAAKLVKLGEDTRHISDLMTEIARGAQEVLGADLVDIYQYDQGYDEFPPEFLTQVGERKVPINKTRIYPDDVAYTIVKNDKPLYESNAQANAELTGSYEQHIGAPAQRFVIRENIHSMAAIPMKVGSETVGVLFSSYHEKQIFSAQQKELIDLFAAQAAIAIRNMRLLLRQQALEQFGEAVSSKAKRLREAEVLELIVTHASKIMDTSNMYIALYDQASDSLRFDLAYQNGKRIDYPSRKINHQKLGKTEAILFREPYYILQSTQAEVAAWFAQPNHQEFVEIKESSWLGVRMSIEDKVLGVIATYHHTREGVYSSDDLATLQTIANQAAIAIDNARMYYGINRKLDSIVRFAEKVSWGKRLEEWEVNDLIYDEVKEQMNSESMYIAQYDDKTEQVHFSLAYQNGRKIDVKNERVWQPRKAGKGKTEEIIRTKEPILHVTLAEAKAWYAAPGREEYIGSPAPSWLGVPMIMGEQVLGIIAVYHETEEFLYTEDDQSILQAIANQAAVALDNAHRYYETEQNLHALVEFGQAITDIHIPRQKLLKLIREKADQFLDADNMFIALCAREDEKDIIKFEIVYRDGLPTSRPDRPASEGRVGEIIRTRKAIFLPTRKDIAEWLDQHEYKEKDPSNSWLGVPMIVGNKVLGVIGVDHPTNEKWYSGEDQEILQALANLAAIALENSSLYEKARGDLIASQQLATLGTAIAALQHRIGNTLNIISPNVKRLRDRLNTNDPQVEEILGIIDRNTRYTSNLLTRIQEPLQEVALSNVDVNAVVTEIFNIRRKEWVDDKTHRLIESHIELGKGIPIIQLPVGQLSEVLSNLIDNAYRALDKSFSEKNIANGAKLSVVSKLEGATITIRVIDNVPGGIPLSVRNKLFEKPVPSKTPNEGSGLGLWLSRLIMQRIGGNIRIEHTSLVGTTMLVEIPAQVQEDLSS